MTIRKDWTEVSLLAAIPALLIIGILIPEWLRFILQISLASGLAALGVMLQMRAGLVSFGHGLYYCLGGYAVGMAGYFLEITDAFLSILLGIFVSVSIAYLLGFLMSRYREIFFAMLSMSLSMILYGLIVKSEVLGSTDGFNLPKSTFLGWAPEEGVRNIVVYSFTCVCTVIVALLLNRYLRSPMGYIGEALGQNEIRLEYLGTSTKRTIHIKYVLAGGIAGIGGALTALSVGHIDPEMAYWTTSGQFVFINLLSGTGNVIAPILGTFLLELLRIYATEISPNTWEMILGTVMLLVILFLPKGIWSLFTFWKRMSAL